MYKCISTFIESAVIYAIKSFAVYFKTFRSSIVPLLHNITDRENFSALKIKMTQNVINTLRSSAKAVPFAKHFHGIHSIKMTQAVPI